MVFVRNFYRKIKVGFAKRVECKRCKKKITDKYKKINNPRRLSKSQIQEVQDFYKNIIGRKVSLYSHEYFYARTGIFAKDYIPSDLYYCDILPRANNQWLKPAYADKNICDILFANEKQPRTILKNMNGYFYSEGHQVSREDAVELCRNLDNVIIKPSLLSKGEGVQCISVKDGIVETLGINVEQLFRKYDKNFIVQDCLKQHADMSALNPTSVNTLRILSYHSGLDVLIIYSVVRIGRLGAVIDNQSSGGISVTIDSEGRLGKYAFGGVGDNSIEKTDTGIAVDGYQLPSYDKAINMVKRMHQNLPFFDIVGWDIAIDEVGNPVLIEYNTRPGLSQSAFGSGMGEYTGRVLKELWPKLNTMFCE